MSRVPRVSGVAPPHVVPFPARHSEEHLASARIPTDLSLSKLAPGGQRVESKPQGLPPAAAAAAAAAASFEPQSRSLGAARAPRGSDLVRPLRQAEFGADGVDPLLQLGPGPLLGAERLLDNLRARGSRELMRDSPRFVELLPPRRHLHVLVERLGRRPRDAWGGGSPQ